MHSERFGAGSMPREESGRSQEGAPGARVTYSQQYRRCSRPGCPLCRQGKPGHGPYWYAYWREDGRARSSYVGKQLPSDVAEAVALTGVRPEATAPCSSVAPPETRPAGATPDDRARGSEQADTAACRAAGQPPGAQRSPVPVLRVRTLGGFGAWRGEEELSVRAWEQRHVGALFKRLLSAPGGQLPREQLSEELWPEAEAAFGARQLTLTLYRLRRALADPVSGETYLHTEGALLVLRPAGQERPPPDWLDAAAFEQAAARALAGEDPAACRAALTLYGGEYLPGDPYAEWAAARREALRLRQLAVRLRLAELAGQRGEVAEAEGQLRAVLDQDACQEDAAARLMGLLATRGRGLEALRVYEALAAALQRELGVSPSRDLVLLRRQLLASQAAPIASQPAPAAPRRTNLPVPLSSYVARPTEEQRLATSLGTARLVTLTGAGGGGKTRLALQVGGLLLDHYRDGVWLAQLAALEAGTDGGVERAVAAALGLGEESIHSFWRGTLLRATRPLAGIRPRR